MELFTTILFWAGIVMMVDGSLALLFLEKWQKLISGMNIRRVALIEIGIALAMLTWHFTLKNMLIR